MSTSQWLNPETAQNLTQKDTNQKGLKAEINKWMDRRTERGLNEFQF